MEQKLHTPEGVRDIYNRECETKLTLQRKLGSVLHLYGYQDIQTPTFEFDDVFRKEIGSTSTKELYRFFDRDGNILALRPDITPSVARAAATLFEGEDFPIRLCYVGNTFINHSSYQGRLKENTQMGAELIGLDSVEADAEMIAMVVDGLKKTGLTEFQVNIGHIDFIQSLLEATGLDAAAGAVQYFHFPTSGGFCLLSVFTGSVHFFWCAIPIQKRTKYFFEGSLQQDAQPLPDALLPCPR